MDQSDENKVKDTDVNELNNIDQHNSSSSETDSCNSKTELNIHLKEQQHHLLNKINNGHLDVTGLHPGTNLQQPSDSPRKEDHAKQQLRLETLTNNSDDSVSADLTTPLLESQTKDDNVIMFNNPMGPELDADYVNSETLTVEVEVHHDTPECSGRSGVAVPCTSQSPVHSGQVLVSNRLPLNLSGHFDHPTSSTVDASSAGEVDLCCSSTAESGTVCVSPVQASRNSGTGFVVGGQSTGGATGLSPHPDDVKSRYQQAEDKMNRAEHRQLADEVTGASPLNSEPNNDIEVLRQQSTDSEENGS